MKLKSIIGFCNAKGCKRKYDYEVEISANTKSGKRVKRKCRLCHDHALLLIHGGDSKSITYEHTVDFD